MKNTNSKDVLNFGIKLKIAARVVFFVELAIGVLGILIPILFDSSSSLIIVFIPSIIAPLSFFILILLSYHFIGLGHIAINTVCKNSYPEKDNSYQ